MRASSLARAGAPSAGARASRRARRPPAPSPRAASSSSSPSPAPALAFRPGTDADAWTVRASVLREGMNPLGLDPARFIVAEDAATRDVLGFGQLKPWETLSDREDAAGAVVRLLGLAPNWDGDLVELASVVVAPSARRRGVGAALLRELVDEACRRASAKGTALTLCLLTLRRTTPFYRRAGFEVVEDEEAIPRPLRPEKAAGSVVAKLVADDECVVMRYRPDRDPGQQRA